MLLDWFNAREAVAVGSALADDFLPEAGSPASGPRAARRSGGGRPDLQKFLQRVAKEARPLRLNLFKRAKLLGSFKWKLLEHGVDKSTAEELTHMVLMQLSGLRTESGTPTLGYTAPRPAKLATARKIPTLLAEIDALLARGETAKSVALLQEVIAIDPRFPVAHDKLGAVFFHLGRYGEAEHEFRRAIELKGSLADAHYNLGTLLRWKGAFPASEESLRRAVKLDPRNAEALISLGMTLGMRDRLSEARSCVEKALRISSRNASAQVALGWLASMGGRFAEAEKHYRAALEVDPKRAEAWALLADTRRMTAADGDWLQGAERALESGVPPIVEAQLRFAMGKYFDDLAKFPRAFAEFKRANELQKRVAVSYDRAARAQFVDDMIGLYTPEKLAQPLPGANDSAKPVFVVGMMRSGTSLVEQIIASHPNAFGAGELEYWPQTTLKHEQVLRRELPDPVLAKKLADGYLKVLAQHSPDAERIVDKAPVNSDHLGIIHSVFPQARFIYMRRDPVDTCMSCYFQGFANAANFTMDLADLAHYYREHRRLVDHWRSALPDGTLLEVPYAELVADQEAWSRRIMDFIGLEWDPRVLEFHKTERPVVTASSWQVRQRVYSSSVGRWKNYQKFLGPLLKLRDLEADIPRT
jgi:tetratricopeptide (TPR) repeat protein